MLSQLTNHISCDISLPPEQIVERLEPWVIHPKSVRGGLFSVPDYQKYEGVIQGSTFRLCRIVGGRTIVTPVVSGNLVSTESGSRINARIHLRKRTWGILAVVAVVMISGSVLSGLGYLQGTEEGTLSYLTGPLFLIALFLILRTQVQHETKAFMKTLERIKKAQD